MGVASNVSQSSLPYQLRPYGIATSAVHLLQEKEEERLREEFAKQGIKIPVKEKSELFDSNTITPGTPFMHRLSIALQYYIHCRLNKDPGWKNITVSLAMYITCVSPIPHSPGAVRLFRQPKIIFISCCAPKMYEWSNMLAN